MPSSHASEEQQQQEQPPQDAPDLSAELERMEDRFKRAVADLDNFRKRSARELERLVTERGDAVLRDWLEVVDGVERALRQQPDGPLHEGLRAVLDQMDSVLDRHGVRRLGKVGEPFDPARHEAIQVVETADAPDHSVVDVARSGYARGDHVLRPAQVVVTRTPRQAET
jgi:molecular chaperone GrpE